jgi:hypothetical protein
MGRTKPKQDQPPQPRTVRVGDSIAVPAGMWLLVLPDGTPVTVRSTYTVRHVGAHQGADGAVVFVGTA